ncbi:hypothetical protein AB595_10575 [Massilia sp. WF1]|nr:hypothetical protein AM586_26955 [Massilia sp. WG5]KLU36849.1 hypothetical protein AB595_10575 [Massilia sp. WF1]
MGVSLRDRALVLRIEPAARSRPFGLPSLTPSRLAALRAALALPVDQVDRPRGLGRLAVQRVAPG